MRKVAIVGIGQTPVREHWETSLRNLAVDALRNAMDDADVDDLDALCVGNMLSGALSDQEHLGALIADYAGLEGVEAVKVEAACGSGGAALRMAVKAVATGVVEKVGVVGVEKLTEYSGKHSTSALATAADADYETTVGLSFVGINALLMQRYLYEYKAHADDFSIFPINAHRNAQYNPYAMFNFPVTQEQYMASKAIADPVRLLDSSPIADGAAALIVVPLDEVDRYKGKPVAILACEVGMDSIAIDNRENPLWLKGVAQSAKKAFKVSGLSHKDINLLELHDAFSIMSTLSLEASGFAEPGNGLRFAHETGIGIAGGLPLTTAGGLKGRGHPVGATGVYQVVEAIRQLRGDMPDQIQVARNDIAMTQNIGGSGATVISTILKRIP